MIMYLNTEILGDEITEILKEKLGEKDLYKLDDVLNQVVKYIDGLRYEIEDLKEENEEIKDNYKPINKYQEIGMKESDF